MRVKKTQRTARCVYSRQLTFNPNHPNVSIKASMEKTPWKRADFIRMRIFLTTRLSGVWDNWGDVVCVDSGVGEADALVDRLGNRIARREPGGIMSAREMVGQ